jgi:hypothetical protein
MTKFLLLFSGEGSKHSHKALVRDVTLVSTSSTVFEKLKTSLFKQSLALLAANKCVLPALLSSKQSLFLAFLGADTGALFSLGSRKGQYLGNVV